MARGATHVLQQMVDEAMQDISEQVAQAKEHFDGILAENDSEIRRAHNRISLLVSEVRKLQQLTPPNYFPAESPRRTCAICNVLHEVSGNVIRWKMHDEYYVALCDKHSNLLRPTASGWTHCGTQR